MARVRTRTPQQRDARELALTRPSDPYRGALTDPFTPRIQTPPKPTPPRTAQLQSPPNQHRTSTDTRAVEPVIFDRRTRNGQPGSATLAGIIGLILGLVLGIFGLLLVTIVSLQDEYGAPDRSFYRGTDSGYVVLGLIDFGLAALCAIGSIVMFTGRITGRIALTIGGWASLILSCFWLVDSSIRWFVPIVVALAAAVMLFAAYTRSVTRWLGVLSSPQPE